jgi:hypothetical protein
MPSDFRLQGRRGSPATGRNAVNNRFRETVGRVQFHTCPPHLRQKRLSIRIYEGDVRHVDHEHAIFGRGNTLPVAAQF